MDGFGGVEDRSHPLHLGGRLVDHPVGIGDQRHRLATELVGDRSQPQHLLAQRSDGHQQADDGEHTGARGDEDGDLTGGHDQTSLDGAGTTRPWGGRSAGSVTAHGHVAAMPTMGRLSTCAPVDP